ncbi:hypothetical protein QTO34_007328, partial [Cnephaeus nilssonii]
MSDLLLLGLIGGLTLLLLLTLLAFARYSGLLAGVAVSAGSPRFRNVTVAYKFHVGPYSETGRLFTESCSVCPRLRSIAVYYDNPHMVRSLLPCGRAHAVGTCPTGLWAPRAPRDAETVPVECAGNVVWATEMALRAGLECHPGDTPALPPQVPPEKCRCAVGSILSEGEESPSSELIQLYQKFGFKVFSFPAPSHVVTATFPYTTALSIWLAARRVHPALDAYIKVRQAWNVCAGA